MTQRPWKQLATLFLLAGMTGVSFGAWALGMAGSQHNLTIAGNSEQACAFCHAPHTDDGLDGAGQAPAWSGNVAPGSFQVFGGQMTAGSSSLQDGSQACLSCHDGVIGFDQRNRAKAPTQTVSTGGFSLTLPQGATNNHPVSVPYGQDHNADYKPLSAVVAAGLPLFGAAGDQVECGTCHDAHGSKANKFLRTVNSAAGLCNTCHNK